MPSYVAQLFYTKYLLSDNSGDRMSDWLAKVAALSEPIKNKNKTNRDLLAMQIYLSNFCLSLATNMLFIEAVREQLEVSCYCRPFY